MSFHVVHNAVELSKLSFLGRSAVEGMMPGHRLADSQTFNICQAIPNVLCDVVQSLDDPNHYGHPTRPDSLVSAVSPLPDAERGVAIWESRPFVWAPGSRDARHAEACRIGLTDFPFAASKDVILKIYPRVFFYPATAALYSQA